MWIQIVTYVILVLNCMSIFSLVIAVAGCPLLWTPTWQVLNGRSFIANSDVSRKQVSYLFIAAVFHAVYKEKSKKSYLRSCITSRMLGVNLGLVQSFSLVIRLKSKPEGILTFYYYSIDVYWFEPVVGQFRGAVFWVYKLFCVVYVPPDKTEAIVIMFIIVAIYCNSKIQLVAWIFCYAFDMIQYQSLNLWPLLAANKESRSCLLKLFSFGNFRLNFSGY